VTHAHNPKGEWTSHHLMSVNGKFDGIARGDLLAVAERFSIPNARKALMETAAALDRWPEFAAEAELAESRIREIAQDFQPME
jgi:serine/threonine-protein kinase HipA